MQMLNGQSCAARVNDKPELVAQLQATPTPFPTPTPFSTPTPFGATPTPIPTTPIAPAQQGPGTIYATPFPVGSAVTPPPVPTPTPPSNATPGPVFLTRASAPPSIAPAQPYAAPPSPSPAPSAVPTLRPGYIAVLADKITGSTKPGIPGDATGNVHIFYQDEVLIGDRAHYDGFKTITVEGDPYIVNSTKNSVLYADKIVFDTLNQKADLYKGRGESSQGVEKGLVYYSSVDMHSDNHGVAHGDYASLTTCENARGGYHITGRTIDVVPSDRIVITKAVLWLGAAAVFFLPRVVIPLRTVTDQRQKPQFFPDIGYNSYQGYYVRTKIGFGKDQYYYGTYDIEFYTKQGTTLGYDGYLAKKNGKRVSQIAIQRVENRVQGNTTYNAQAQDTENFSQNLRAQLGFSYQGAYGPYTNFPPQEQYQGTVTHTKPQDSQSYSFTRSTTGSQGSNESYGFTDTRTFSALLQNQLSANLSHSDSNYGGFTSSNATGTVNDLLHWQGHGADYQLNYSKTFARQPYGINKEPELEIRPLEFAPHFIFPIEPDLTVGEYNEPATPETTQRADLALNMGPALYKVFGSDLSATLNVNQFYYGTGDEKANIQQNITLTTPVGNHFVNDINYNEQNFNGPGAVPFSTLDVQSNQNIHNATDIVRFFNSDIYNLTLSFADQFNAMAQPVTYQLTTKPSPRSYATFSGTWVPGPGNGFQTTNFEITTPFGRGSWLQFLGDVNYKEKSKIENKSIYYSHIVGDCYEIQLSYNENARSLNMTISLLAFPSHAATFGFSQQGSIVPSSFNGGF